jgi:tetratricopeptide (TPR) repeat protein
MRTGRRAIGAHRPTTANILYRLGRLHLHETMTTEALRFFQLAQIAAHDGAGASTVALLCANEAWAYGILGNSDQARRCLERAEDELSRIEQDDTRPWISFFGATDRTALAGMTHLALASHPHASGRLDLAEENLHASVRDRGQDMPRSRALELAALAIAHLREGNTDHGLTTGHQAADLAEQLRSVRLWQRLAPLAHAATQARHPDADTLTRRLQETPSQQGTLSR